MSRCTAFMLLSRSDPPARSLGSNVSRLIVAVRLRRAPRRRIDARTPNTSVAVAMKTVAARIKPALSSRMSNSDSMISDPEIDETIHDEIAQHHPSYGAPQHHLGQVVLP